jgi:hypothetical protein
MSKKQRNINQCVCCEDCSNLVPIGEGDHICDADFTKMPIEEYAPTKDYFWCKGRKFIGW